MKTEGCTDHFETINNQKTMAIPLNRNIAGLLQDLCMI